ncbi:hypothetical protein OSB04_005731 [Centaurea solstitialis]|uniref:Uncharacterized protein n=1 Tax=Centaurea solstitialis TaxID=347529 RepID=A0AA38WS99_9ASTR|nr:hypothetical protein OSB04_005731 [Centaurea solstitialis]
MAVGFERVSLLKKLKVLKLKYNNVMGDSFVASLSHVLPLLKSLDLFSNKLSGPFPAEELSHLTNLEELDLSRNNLDGTPSIQDCKQLSSLKKLKSIRLYGNKFNKSIILCLSSLPFLRTLDLWGTMNDLEGSFPAKGIKLTHVLGVFGSKQAPTNPPGLWTLDFRAIDLESPKFSELAHMTNLEELDLSDNRFNDTPSIQDCRRLSRLKKLKSIALRFNDFNKSIILCLSELPSLDTLDLSEKLSGLKELETLDLSFCGLTSLTSDDRLEVMTTDGMAHQLPHLKVLLLSDNSFNGTQPMDALASFHNLEVLDLSRNYLVGSIPSTIQALSSLRAVSFAYNYYLNGSLLALCELKNLHELDLSDNAFDGNLPQCFDRLTSLKLLDISYNQFTGTLPPSLIANLTSLEYVDFSGNSFEGSFSFSLFANHKKLEAVQFLSNNNKFEVETEEPIGWVPRFQLKVLLLPSCNINRPNGRVFPKFLLHQRMLQLIDLSHNSLVGQFPYWLIENNTMLEGVNLRNNAVSGVMRMSQYRNASIMRWLDMSENDMNGTIPTDIQKFLPNIHHLNLSSNSLDGVIPPSIGDLRKIWSLDLSNNGISGEVPKGLFSNLSSLSTLKLSKNRLHGQVLSGNLSMGSIYELGLDNNCFTGKIGNWTVENGYMQSLDISNNLFTGTIPHWLSNMMEDDSEFIVSNNGFQGPFPCGTTSFSFLDISQNSFSGPIPSCLDFRVMKHLHLGSNGFTGSIPNVFRNLTSVLTLDIGNNSLSGKIPDFLGNLSDLRILILRQNNFIGSIPMQLCQLSNLSLIDLSSNSLSSSIPSCLQSITTAVYPAFELSRTSWYDILPSYAYQSVLNKQMGFNQYLLTVFETQDEVQFTTKALSLAYKGLSNITNLETLDLSENLLYETPSIQELSHLPNLEVLLLSDNGFNGTLPVEGSILDLMVGLDLSDNKLTGEIPNELGLLTAIRSLNLSHNQLSGPIPVNFSNLANMESLDLSSNNLSGEVPSELIKLTYLAVFNVSYNNLSGKLPETKAQFGTFTEASYEGNPLLCGPPLEKKCTATSDGIDPTEEGNDKWYDIDFLASFCGTLVVFMLGFAAVLYINPYWHRRWLEFLEECMYTCYYFLEDSVRYSSYTHK